MSTSLHYYTIFLVHSFNYRWYSEISECIFYKFSWYTLCMTFKEESIWQSLLEISFFVIFYDWNNGYFYFIANAPR